ncbi:hypothetical protein [Hydrotalea sandarakina]|jgi:hypothetical protein|uniref:Uncharacterized protein n=1 Tax=Hydrotalea sandarakina TaxID=1004304 RepID=A0A2W7RIN0_9BACT|nr:hypothetical protein [Hydrotalea sandarakina]PZX60713.1 hypothetical protein LX80_02491 [Hydrotalea sandarakina]
MLKSLIAAFLLFTISLQILPIKQVGALLFNNVITEELAHGHGVEKDTIKKFNSPYNLLCNPNQHISILSFNALNVYIARSEKLPIRFKADILVPPPNA